MQERFFIKHAQWLSEEVSIPQVSTVQPTHTKKLDQVRAKKILRSLLCDKKKRNAYKIYSLVKTGRWKTAKVIASPKLLRNTEYEKKNFISKYSLEKALALIINIISPKNITIRLRVVTKKGSDIIQHITLFQKLKKVVMQIIHNFWKRRCITPPRSVELN